MQTSPNQKIMYIQKSSNKSDSIETNYYSKININSMYLASKHMTLNEFRVYMYMVTNQYGYKVFLSPSDISNKMGEHPREIQKSINKLIEKQYIIKYSKNKYIFRENIAEKIDTEICTGCSIQHVEKPHVNVRENFTLTRAIPSGQREGIAPRNIKVTLNNNTLVSSDTEIDSSAGAASKPPSELTDYESNPKNNYKKLSDVPDEFIDKVIELFQEGYKYNKEKPQIQNETGLSGRIVYRIVEGYKDGKIKLKKVANVDTDDTLKFDDKTGSISREFVNSSIENIFDKAKVIDILKGHYKVAMSHMYDENKEKVINWFKRNIDFEYEKEELGGDQNESQDFRYNKTD